MSSKSPGKAGNVRFTTVPLKPLSVINNVEDNVDFSRLKGFNSDNSNMFF